MVVSIELTDKIDYTKKPLTLAEQVARLKTNGGLFLMMKARQLLIFSISATIGFVHTLIRSKRTAKDSEHTFTRKDIHFKDIIDLYCFDRRLRSLIFNIIEKIEVAVRTKLYRYMPKAQAIAIGS